MEHKGPDQLLHFCPQGDSPEFWKSAEKIWPGAAEVVGVLEIILSTSKSTACHKVVSRLYKAILQSKTDNTFYIKKEVGEGGKF